MRVLFRRGGRASALPVRLPRPVRPAASTRATPSPSSPLRVGRAPAASPPSPRPDRAPLDYPPRRQPHLQRTLPGVKLYSGVPSPARRGIMESYYINLLSGENDGANWEESLECSPIEEQQCPVEQVLPSNKSSSKRSKNFNEREDTVLVSAWLNISLDAAQGNEQSLATYWKRIHSYFRENKDFESDRTQNSLLHCWSTIQEHVNKLCGYNDRIKRRRQRGVTKKDKHRPKWTDKLSQKKQKVTISSTPATSSTANSFAGGFDSQGEAPSQEDVSLKRPIGKKAAKARLRQGSCSSDGSEKVYMEALDNIWSRKSQENGVRDQKKDERYERAYALEQERIATEKERLQLKRQELELRRMVEEEKIMKIDTSAMDGPLKQYYISLKSDILARRCGGSS